MAQPADSDATASSPDQNYDELPVNELLKKQQFEISRILIDGTFPAAGPATFDQFYLDYFLPRWSLVRNITSLPDYRHQLRNNFQKAKGRAVHNHLNALVLAFMSKLAAGNFHPAVRVNAMLMIGELNDVESVGGTAAVPMAEALNVLIGAVESDKVPDAVRAAAMVGILRHAEAGIRDEDARRSTAAAMLRLTAAAPPRHRRARPRVILAKAVEVLEDSARWATAMPCSRR